MAYGQYAGRRDGSAKQEWSIGDAVRVGFVAGLTVIERVATPGNFRPDAWVLQSRKGTFYRFVPHCGLSRCASLADARLEGERG